eukprot:tig00021037_g17470.t1
MASAGAGCTRSFPAPLTVNVPLPSDPRKLFAFEKFQLAEYGILVRSQAQYKVVLAELASAGAASRSPGSAAAAEHCRGSDGESGSRPPARLAGPYAIRRFKGCVFVIAGTNDLGVCLSCAAIDLRERLEVSVIEPYAKPKGWTEERLDFSQYLWRACEARCAACPQCPPPSSLDFLPPLADPEPVPDWFPPCDAGRWLPKMKKAPPGYTLRRWLELGMPEGPVPDAWLGPPPPAPDGCVAAHVWGRLAPVELEPGVEEAMRGAWQAALASGPSGHEEGCGSCDCPDCLAEKRRACRRAERAMRREAREERQREEREAEERRAGVAKELRRRGREAERLGRLAGELARAAARLALALRGVPARDPAAVEAGRKLARLRDADTLERAAEAALAACERGPAAAAAAAAGPAAAACAALEPGPRRCGAAWWRRSGGRMPSGPCGRRPRRRRSQPRCGPPRRCGRPAAQRGHRQRAAGAAPPLETGASSLSAQRLDEVLAAARRRAEEAAAAAGRGAPGAEEALDEALAEALVTGDQEARRRCEAALKTLRARGGGPAPAPPPKRGGRAEAPAPAPAPAAVPKPPKPPTPPSEPPASGSPGSSLPTPPDRARWEEALAAGAACDRTLLASRLPPALRSQQDALLAALSAREEDVEEVLWDPAGGARALVRFRGAAPAASAAEAAASSPFAADPEPSSTAEARAKTRRARGAKMSIFDFALSSGAELAAASSGPAPGPRPVLDAPSRGDGHAETAAQGPSEDRAAEPAVAAADPGASRSGVEDPRPAGAGDGAGDGPQQRARPEEERALTLSFPSAIRQAGPSSSCPAQERRRGGACPAASSPGPPRHAPGAAWSSPHHPAPPPFHPSAFYPPACDAYYPRESGARTPVAGPASGIPPASSYPSGLARRAVARRRGRRRRPGAALRARLPAAWLPRPRPGSSASSRTFPAPGFPTRAPAPYRPPLAPRAPAPAGAGAGPAAPASSSGPGGGEAAAASALELESLCDALLGN